MTASSHLHIGSLEELSAVAERDSASKSAANEKLLADENPRRQSFHGIALVVFYCMRKENMHKENT
jgi:hypothetical protein